MRPVNNLENPSKAAPEATEGGQHHRTIAYRVEGIPGLPPNTYMVCCHPIHGPVSFRPGSCATPQIDNSTEVSSTVLVHSPCPESPHRFLPWCQKKQGPYPGRTNATTPRMQPQEPTRAPTTSVATAPPKKVVSSETHILGFVSASSMEQYQWGHPAGTPEVSKGPHTTKPSPQAAVAPAKPAAMPAMEAHLHPYRMHPSANKASQPAATQESHPHRSSPPPATQAQPTGLPTQVAPTMQASSQGRCAQHVAFRTSVGEQQVNVFDTMKENISGLNKMISNAQKKVCCAQKNLTDMVKLGKQRRDELMGRISALNQKLKMIQESRKTSQYVDHDEDEDSPDMNLKTSDADWKDDNASHNVLRWLQQSASQAQEAPCNYRIPEPPTQRVEAPPSHMLPDQDGIERESLRPSELLQRLAQWQQQLAQKMTEQQATGHQPASQEAGLQKPPVNSTMSPGMSYPQIRGQAGTQRPGHLHQHHVTSSFTHLYTTMQLDPARQ